MSLVGTKVKDGLFVGGSPSAHDMESAIACKVTRVINCCGREVSNQWESIGVKYLTYDWEDNGSQVVLDKGDFVINEVYDFIEEALAREEGVLIHSSDGESRSCCVCAAYLMKRYRWSLKKTMEFMKSRDLGADIKMGLMQQLQSYEKRMAVDCKAGPLARDWDEVCELTNSDEALVRNTFVNIKGASDQTVPVEKPSSGSSSSSIRPKWLDLQGGKLTEEQQPEEPKSPLSSLMSGKQEKVKPIVPGAPGRSAMKGERMRAAQGSAAPSEEQPIVADSVKITTRSCTVECSTAEIMPRRFGLKYRSSCIVLEYEVPTHGLRAHHVIKVCLNGDNSEGSDHDKSLVEQLLKEHSIYLQGVSSKQLAELVARIRTGRSTIGARVGGS